jgi:REP element-mobilizing transposase RayT
MNQRPYSNQTSRRSIRLKEYDYSQAGAYFVTVCTHRKTILFGNIVAGGIRLNPFGLIVKECWEGLPQHDYFLKLDVCIIMPNHIHGILMLTDHPNVGAGFKPAPASRRHALPEIVRALKTFSARRINEIRGTPGQPVWQRNYYEHVIRNEMDLEETREYIQNNPLKWLEDEYHTKDTDKIKS